MQTRSPSQTNSAPNSAFTPVSAELLQRKCACGHSAGLTGKCSECESQQRTLQKKATHRAKSSEIPAIVRNVLATPGQPLDSDTRGFMESRFKHDFSQVRVHTDAKAAASAQAVNAQAYTTNQDIVFDTGRYQPQTREGKRLLAHELTHVLQQRPVIARQAETIPVGEFTTRSPGWERALTYEPRMPDPNVTQPPSRVKPEAGQYDLQTPEILIQRSPTFDPDCNEYDRCRVIEPISVANQLIDRVLAVLPPIANGTMTSGRIVDLLNVHFHDPSAIATRANAVLIKFQEIKTELNSTNFICHPTAGDCESEEGRVGAFTRLCSPGSAINLCQTYYEQVCAEKARLLIHEAAHNVIGSCRDYAYVHEPGYMALSAEQASLNSDTYAQFAKMVFLGTPNCQDCSTEIQLRPGQY